MKKALIFAITAALLLAFTLPGHSWTGRMAGMGNPYGLVEDESDFLTHPTAITQGKGWQYFGDLGINYTKTTAWDVGAYFPSTPIMREADGKEWTADASFGFAFPINTGRMGIFLNYSGNALSPAKYSGSGFRSGFDDSASPFDMKSEYDKIGIKAIYAQPFTDKVKFGGEFGITWKLREKNDIMTTITYDPTDPWYLNNDVRWYEYTHNFMYMFPADSPHWETNMKAAIEAMIGKSKLNVTVLGGFILGGKNNYSWSSYDYDYNWADMNGSISGWNIGTEVWWRFPVSNTVAIPALLRVNYAEKRRDGNGSGVEIIDGYPPAPYLVDYTSREKLFSLEAGGGVDVRFGNAGRFAGGLYYGYIDNKYDFAFNNRTFRDFISDAPYPQWKEHRVALKLASELNISPKASLNLGFNFFYGWVTQDFGRYRSGTVSNISNDGHIWGMGLSAGAAFKFNGIVFEPYLKGGYQRINLSGDGSIAYGIYSYDFIPASDYKKTQWNVGGGFAIKFN